MVRALIEVVERAGVSRQKFLKAAGLTEERLSDGDGRFTLPEFDVIQRVQGHTFKGGIYSFGLKEDGVGYIYDDRNKPLIPDSVHARVEALKQEIIAGRIKVPSTR